MRRRHTATLLVALGFAIAVLLSLVTETRASCRLTEREWYNPTGWEGCTVYGDGLASRWAGPGVARNDCLWPWDRCTPIVITSLTTGRSVVVQPAMFCDCWHTTRRQKLVDLDPRTLSMLGLDWADGVYRVRVEPARVLPDTAVSL